MSYENLLLRLDECGRGGLDGSPGDAMAREAAAALREVERRLSFWESPDFKQAGEAADRNGVKESNRAWQVGYAQSQRDGAAKYLDSILPGWREFHDKKSQAEARVRVLEEALRNYTRHARGCAINYHRVKLIENCDCGLREILHTLSTDSQPVRNERVHVLSCNEFHQHRAPRCCDLSCWCRGSQPDTSEPPRCVLCGHAMPVGEEMFKHHGYSGGCPNCRTGDPCFVPIHPTHQCGLRGFNQMLGDVCDACEQQRAEREKRAADTSEPRCQRCNRVRDGHNEYETHPFEAADTSPGYNEQRNHCAACGHECSRKAINAEMYERWQHSRDGFPEPYEEYVHRIKAGVSETRASEPAFDASDVMTDEEFAASQRFMRYMKEGHARGYPEYWAALSGEGELRERVRKYEELTGQIEEWLRGQGPARWTEAAGLLALAAPALRSLLGRLVTTGGNEK